MTLAEPEFTLAAVGLAAVSASFGYWLALSNRHPSTPHTTSSGNDNSNPGHVEAEYTDNYKLILVVRTDLKMSTGKIAAQCRHATLACYKALARSNPRILKQWEQGGQAKVAVRCSSEEELLEIQAHAQRLNLGAQSIRDAGRTQITAGSRTVLGVGPGPARLINQVTGKLRLL
ncbi:PTH2-domain-containing protein [Artomyces pyxidatus]|uniref:PTH2-domain-containing protein n=1 Tax=Artomyces pyxidatus TaxID=48021 RepID=A0ACB8THH1_9AGAM|nr:PTH2-domain-containing protein [Artomyces pyxidatus]